MAERDSNRLMDPKTGFCRQTGIYSCLRPPIPLPPINQPLSTAEFCFSIFNSTFTDGATTFSVNSTTGETLSYSQFVSQVRSLAYSLQQRYSLCQNDVAFILSPPSIHIPVVYFALLSLGIVVSPANPLTSNSEIAHQTNSVIQSFWWGGLIFEEMLRAVEKYKVTGMPVSPPLVVAFVKLDLTKKIRLELASRAWLRRRAAWEGHCYTIQ
ncbi:hypothetical protein J1N35_002737 [Gossypium stocksii]|uniref:AMP-dependent synthetase/ligase domain-containing protein n=1 Tax=Gossypium stocksii TaxID=47602 RepID=A0A9D4ANX4_9ROSI|nr:hypothetical protein J1N35_002737 [Gossypium stocksii]